MGALVYLLQVSACIAIFYGFYYFLLSRLTFFTLNRYYLLSTLLLSFIIPVLTIHLHQTDTYPTVMRQAVYVNTLQTFPITHIVTNLPKATAPVITWLQVLKVVYLLAVLAFFVHLIMALINFFARLRNGKIDRIGKVNILRGNKNLANGSFLNYIFLNDDELSADEMQQIIAHEMLHVKLLHSVDRIIAKIIQIILWFNPFVYFYVRSIEENHEFEVDREIARSTDKNNYADLLLHLSIAKQGMLYHSFSKVPLKKRIIMLFNKPSSGVKRVVYILIIPVIVISCLTFAHLIKDKTPEAKKIIVKKHNTTLQLYSRTTFKKPDGKSYDKVMIQQKSGGSASSEIPAGGKVGFLIKDKLYSENDFKNLPVHIKDSLFNTGGLGATEASNFNILSKLGYHENFSGYDVILRFIDKQQYYKEVKVLEEERKKAHIIAAVKLPPPAPIVANSVKFPPPVVEAVAVMPPNGITTYPASVATEFYDKILSSATDKIQLFQTQNSMAWRLALQSKDLDWAEKTAKQAVEVVNDLLEHPIASQFGNAEQTREAMKGNTFMVGDTYAFILYKEGKYAEALKVQQPLYDRTEKRGGPVCTHYAQILMANNNYALAKDVAERGMKSDLISIELPTVLKEIYIKTNGSDQGYDEYLRRLRLENKPKSAALINPAPLQIDSRYKEATIPAGQFYTRLHLRKENGEIEDKIVIHPPGGSVTATIAPGDKAAFLIDDKVYDENTVQNVSPKTISAINGGYGVEGNRHWPALKKYTAVFTFSTKRVPVDTIKSSGKIKTIGLIAANK